MENGGVAQLGERLPCTQEVIGSNPFTSTMGVPGGLGWLRVEAGSEPSRSGERLMGLGSLKTE